MLIDIHTHQAGASSSVFRLYNASSWKQAPLLADTLIHGTNGLSVGVHPWKVTDWNPQDYDELLAVLSLPEVLVIGEVGLDKVCETPFDKQLELFRMQAVMASQLAKPVLLHQVRALPELLVVKRDYPTISAWIIHGFRGGRQEAMQCLSKGFYLSFGYKLNPEALNVCPIDRMFLETDETGDIERLYAHVASMFKISEKELESALEDNFHRLFPSICFFQG